VLVVDQDQTIIFWNQAAQDMLGHATKEVLGQACYEILKGRSDQGRLVCMQHCRIMRTSIKGEAVDNFDATVRMKWNGVRWVNFSTFTVQHKGNRHEPLLVHLFREATQKKKNEQFVDEVSKQFQELLGDYLLEDPAGATNHIQDFGLTPRQLEVLALLAKGVSTAEIARTLTISPATARNHIRSVLQKLNVHSRLEAVVFALRHGLVP
jgi:PAS domain S-box-containing protein